MLNQIKLSGKKWLAIIVVLVALGLLTACSSKEGQENQAEPQEANGFAMGTVVTQKVYGENGQAAMKEVMEKIEELESLLTFNAPEGDIHKLNEKAGEGLVQLNPETIEIMKKAQQIAEISQGAFDITIGPVIRSWGFGSGLERVPSEEELQELLPLVNYKDLIIEGQKAGLKRAGQMVDLGGIAKGYAGDVAIQIYKKHGIESGFINLGGNVVTLGSKPDGSPWVVGIRNPRPGADGEQIIGVIKVTDKAVVTAGDEQRYFEKDGQRYHHIIDPSTGYPAQSDLLSVTIISDSSFEADALDTAVFILGLEKGRQLVEQYGGVEAVFVTTDKKIYVTEGLKDNFQLVDETGEYEYIE